MLISLWVGGKQTIAAICLWSDELIAGGKLSYISTNPRSHPYVEIVTQWPYPVCNTWTNENLWILNDKVCPRLVSCNPLQRGKDFAISLCDAFTMVSFNHSPDNRICSSPFDNFCNHIHSTFIVSCRASTSILSIC